MKTLADDFNLLLSPLPWKASTEHDDEILDADGGDVGVTFPLTRGGVIVAVNHFDRLVESVEDMVNSGVAFSDPRIDYVEVQLSCTALRDAKKLLSDIAAARKEGADAE